jgi:uncharacterized membrane protein YqjE
MANRAATDPEPKVEPKVSAMLTGIVNDLQDLVNQQLALFRTEIRDDFRRTREAVLSLAGGFALAIVGGLLLTHSLVHLLVWAFPDLPLWGGYGIVAAVLLAAGGALIWRGKASLDSFNPLPDEAAETMKENVQWLMNAKTPK